MVLSPQPHDRLFKAKDVNNQSRDGDLELAYRLQHCLSGDAQVQLLLTERFAAEIHHLVAGWLVFNIRNNVPTTEIREIVTNILAVACVQIKQFWGEDSVRNWIYRLAIKQLDRLYWWRLPSRKIDYPSGSQILGKIMRLSRKQRNILWLRYGMRLNVQDCAFLLERPVPKIRHLLLAARASLMGNQFTDNLEGDCDTCWQDIWERADGLVKGDYQVSERLAVHLRDCQKCQTLAAEVENFEQSLTGEMVSQISSSPPEKKDQGKIIAGIPDHIKKSRLSTLPAWGLKAGWMGLFLLLMVAVGFLWMDKSNDEAMQAALPARQAAQLPDLIQGKAASDILFTDQAGAQQVQFIAQAQSEDGTWVVYSVYEISTENNESTVKVLIFLYDITTKQTHCIFTSQPVVIISTLMWFKPPAISADGSIVVFSAPFHSDGGGGKPCFTQAGKHCLNIYTYEAASDRLTLISQGASGEPADGDSYAPAVSADGRVITFWSDASNFFPGQEQGCDLVQQEIACVKAYIYLPDSGELSLLSSPDLPVYGGLAPMSMSADGSIMAFDTILLTSDNSPEQYSATLIDQQTNQFEDINLSWDGSPGNGNVYGVVIDASGRYVAFASDSSNLVPDDTNGFIDIFWRDRQTGEVHLVTRGFGGEQANAESGAFIPGLGFTGLSLSPDGKQIVFVSAASNLVEKPGSCDGDSEGICNGLYVADIRTGKVELLIARLGSRILIFPEISENGQWITYSVLRDDCPYSPYCSYAFLYDRQRGWTEDIMKNDSEISEYGWNIDSSLSLPSVQTSVLVYSPDGTYLAAANSDARVRVFNVQDSTEYATLEGRSNAMVVSMAISPDNSWLAGVTTSEIAYIWNLQARRLFYILDESTEGINNVFFSPDSTLLYIVTEDELSTWQLGAQNTIRVRRILMESPQVIDTDLAHAGNLLATARQDGTVWLQMLPSGRVMARLNTGENAVYDVMFSIDGKRLASRSMDGNVSVWQISWQGFGALEVSPLATFRISNWMNSLVFNADGSSLATILSSGTVGIWNVNDGQTSLIQTTQAGSLTFSPHGDRLACATMAGIDLYNGPGWTEEMFFHQAEIDILLNTDLLANDVTERLYSIWRPFVSGAGNTLYEADDAWEYALLAPMHIPEEITFKGAYQDAEGGVFLHYIVDEGADATSNLFVQEIPASGKQLPLLVGKSADISTHFWSEIQGEFVRGDWSQDIPVSGGNMYRWDNNVGTAWLRWQQGDLLVTMYYRPSGSGKTILHPEDMLQIAAGFDLVTPPLSIKVNLFEYIVQAGDTCTWIADRFGVDIQSIVQANNLDEGCNTVFADQTLAIPITQQGYLLEDTDLDCDGNPERVEVISGWGFLNTVRVYSIGDNGLYTPFWEWLLEGTSSERFGKVRVVNNGSCANLLLIERVRYFQSDWSSFSWDGSAMQTVVMDSEELEELLQINELNP